MSAALQDAVTLAAELAPMTLAESTLETAISVTCLDLSMALDDHEQRALFARLQDLHLQRTPNQVRRMELAQGLAK